MKLTAWNPLYLLLPFELIKFWAIYFVIFTSFYTKLYYIVENTTKSKDVKMVKISIGSKTYKYQYTLSKQFFLYFPETFENVTRKENRMPNSCLLLSKWNVSCAISFLCAQTDMCSFYWIDFYVYRHRAVVYHTTHYT